MKRFARCTNCRQWYLHDAVTTVEIIRGSGLQRTTLWCQPCIREAEHRSQLTDGNLPVPAETHIAVASHVHHSSTRRQQSVGGLSTASSTPSADSTNEPFAVRSTRARARQPDDFQQFIQEHLDLMERALHEDDTTIVLLVEDFIERIQAYQAQLEEPERVARLASHSQYWSMFLNAMNPDC